MIPIEANLDSQSLTEAHKWYITSCLLPLTYPSNLKSGRVVLRILNLSEHEVAAHCIFHSFCNFLTTMEQSSLLED